MRPKARGSADNWIRRYHESALIFPPRRACSGCRATSRPEPPPLFLTLLSTAMLSIPALVRTSSNPPTAARTPSRLIPWSGRASPWHSNNHTGLSIDSVIRLVSQWQHDGQIYETYDYAKGLGIINWQWMERISTLTPISGDKTGKLFYCENGAVYMQSSGNPTRPPSVLQYDPKRRRIGAALPVILFTSHWESCIEDRSA